MIVQFESIYVVLIILTLFFQEGNDHFYFLPEGKSLVDEKDNGMCTVIN